MPRVKLFQVSCRDQGWIQVLRAFSVGIQKANWHIPKAHVATSDLALGGLYVWSVFGWVEV